MKTLHPLATRLTQCLAIALFLLPPSIHAANFTWNGAGGDDGWGTPLNWVGGVAPGVTGQTLFFAGTNRLTPNNATVTNLSSITFTTNAGSFTLTGNAFTLTGHITNSSGVLQTIENDMTLNNNRSIYTGSGNITLKGALNQTGGARQLYKYGAGTLTLENANTLTGNFFISQGTVLVDTAAGGSLGTTGWLYFGQNSPPPDSIAQGGTLIVRGATSGPTTVDVDRGIYLGIRSGANKIIIDANGGSGTTLSFTNLDGFSFEASTLNVDLSSSSGNKLYFSNAPALANGIYKFFTVTDTINTGFATRDGGTGEITRFTATTNLPASGSSSTGNYHTSGNLTMTGSSSTMNSLTIQGAGTMDGGKTITVRRILMQEGVGDYTITNTTIAGSDSIQFHQYSTAGALHVAGDMPQNDGGKGYAYRIIKTGPGTMIFSGTAEKYSGALDVQQGKFQLDGTIGSVASTYVRDGGILSGTGTIGGGIHWSSGGTSSNIGTRYTGVEVFTGGTLDATPTGSDALTIVGTLAFDTDSTFKMNLAGTNLGALMVTNTNGAGTIVTLDGDLLLTLGYTPTLGDEINLLTWTNGTSSGTFASINGILGVTNVSFAGGYNFDVHYDSDRVWLKNTAIPEPAALTLLFAASTLLLPRRRPRGQQQCSERKAKSGLAAMRLSRTISLRITAVRASLAGLPLAMRR